MTKRSRKPVILHVVHSLSRGGMERSLVSIVSLTRSGPFKHVVCTLRSGGPLLEALPADVEVECLGIVAKSRTAGLRLAGVIRRHQADIVHARNWNTWCDSALAARLARLSPPIVVLGFHGLETAGGFTPVQRRRAKRLRLTYRPFATVSRAGCRQLTRELGVSPDRIRILTNGVDVGRFAPVDVQKRTACRIALNVDEDELVIVTVGSLVEVKDHATALRGIEKCASFPGRIHVLIVGDGPLRSALEARARNWTGTARATFLGAREDVAGVLAAADLFVLSSRYEQMSNALLEAMACGLCVVATDVGDNAVVVEDGVSGCIVPAEAPEAIAGAVIRLGADAAMRKRMGEAARRRMVERFDIHTTAEQYVRYYDSLLSRPKSETQPCAALQA